MQKCFFVIFWTISLSIHYIFTATAKVLCNYRILKTTPNFITVRYSHAARYAAASYMYIVHSKTQNPEHDDRCDERRAAARWNRRYKTASCLEEPQSTLSLCAICGPSAFTFFSLSLILSPTNIHDDVFVFTNPTSAENTCKEVH